MRQVEVEPRVSYGDVNHRGEYGAYRIILSSPNRSSGQRSAVVERILFGPFVFSRISKEFDSS